MTLQPLVVYICFAQPDEWRHWAGTYARHADSFEATSDMRCLVIPFSLASPDLMRRLAPAAVVMSGFARSFQDYEAAAFKPVCDWLLEAGNDTPVLALCGSHQLLGFLYNGDMEGVDRLYDQPMRRLSTGEPITNPDYHSEYYMEKGFFTLELTAEGGADPLFADLTAPPIVCESHYCEIKTLPNGFTLIASTPECRIQAMKHRERPLYGVQFHPEDATDLFPDGRTILRNFFTITASAYTG